MPSKSKIKGSTFERDVAKKLNEFFATDQFSRAFGSGAFVGKSNWDKRKGLSTEIKNALAGDIMVPDWFIFNVECKHYDKSPVYHNLLSINGDVKMNEWLSKSIHDGLNTQTLPLVVFKTTRVFTGMALPYIVSIFTNIQNYCVYKGFAIVDFETGLSIIKSIIDLDDVTKQQLITDFLHSANTSSSIFNILLQQFINS